jgi:hypothetical protein
VTAVIVAKNTVIVSPTAGSETPNRPAIAPVTGPMLPAP